MVNLARLAFQWPGIKQDTVIYADTITIGVTNTINTAGTFIIDLTYAGAPVGLPIGIYNLTINSTWYDTDGSGPINQTDSPLNMTATSNSDGTLSLKYLIAGTLIPGYSSGATMTVNIKVCLLALDAGFKINSPGLFGKQKAYHTGVNYSKIATSGEVVKNLGGSVVVAHNLGYVPTFRVWSKETSGSLTSYYKKGAVVATFNGGLLIDASNLTMYALASDVGSYVYRIYDEA